jgi:hypothetical protein
MLAGAQVRDLLVSKVESLGYNALVYRDENDAITDADVPVVLIQQAGMVNITTIEGTLGGTITHDGSFFLSFAAATRGEAETMLAATSSALLVDYSLGGQVQEIVLTSYGDEDNEGKDFAALVLEISVKFCTSYDDFTTLI